MKIHSDDVEILSEENVEAKMKDKDGNEVEMKGSINNLFDGMDDTFVEIANGMGLELTLEDQIKLYGLIIKMKQGVSEPDNGLKNGRRMLPSIARATTIPVTTSKASTISTSPVSTTSAASTTSTVNRCPSTHPFVYHNGDKCCRTNKEANQADQGDKCDSSELFHDSICCENHDSMPCEHDSCYDYGMSKTWHREMFIDFI